MATISGILINGAGQPLPNVQIVLTALKTSSKVLNQSKALITTTSETGAYSINAQVGNYAVTILRNGYPVEKVGCIKVYVDSQDGTLNDYLLNPNESEISPEILAQIVEERKLAQKSASDAKNSANEAVETLENCVKKTGEASQTVDGTLDVKELKENGQQVYSPNNKPTASDVGALSSSGGEVTGDFKAPNITATISLTIGSAKATYSDSGVNLDKALLINNTPVLKQGDGGIDTRSLPILPDFKSLNNNSGIYRAFGSRVPNTATPNAPSGTGNSRLTVTVRNDGSVAHYEVTENALGAAKKWIGECYSSSGSLVIYWVESITTANINSYVVTETILYPSGSESSPPTINNNQRIVIDNPYPSSKTIVELEIKPTTGTYEWGTYSGSDDNGQPVYSGIKANKLGSKIVIQTANNYILRPSSYDCNPFNMSNGELISSVYYRIRVLKIGA